MLKLYLRFKIHTMTTNFFLKIIKKLFSSKTKCCLAQVITVDAHILPLKVTLTIRKGLIKIQLFQCNAMEK